jgi:hypothetical protein
MLRASKRRKTPAPRAIEKFELLEIPSILDLPGEGGLRNP